MKKIIKVQVLGLALAGAYAGMKVLANATKEKTSIDIDNPNLAASAARNDLKLQRNCL